MKNKGKEMLNNVLGFLGILEDVKTCLACGEPYTEDVRVKNLLFYSKGRLCPSCQKRLKKIDGGTCVRCGRYLDWKKGTPEGNMIFCPICCEKKPSYATAISCYEYEGLCKELLHRMKYENEPQLATLFGEFMAESMGDELFARESSTEAWRIGSSLKEFRLVPVPISQEKLEVRGYNQALCLAKTVGEATGIAVMDGLRRKRDTVVQHKLTKVARNENIKGAFSWNLEYNIFEKKIILIDDIFTTGSTAEECTKALKEAGCGTVIVLTAAGGRKKAL